MSRLLVLLAALTLAVLPCSARAQERLVVLNKSDDTALLLDARTGAVQALLPTGREPHEVAVSPDRRRALVTNYGTRDAPGNTLSLIDLEAAEILETISLGRFTRPHGVAWLDDRRAAVTAEGAGALVIVDLEARRVTAALATGHRLSHMVALSPDGTRAFVPDLASGSLAAFDLKAGTILPETFSGGGAEGVAVLPDGSEVWVTNRADDAVAVFDAATLTLRARIPAGQFPIRVAFTPDGRRALVSNARSGDVSVYDTASRAEIARIRMDAPLAEDGTSDRYFAGAFEGSPIPIGIAVSSDGRRAFVANSNADVVVVLDLDALQPVARFTTGRQPDGIAVW
ncbi:MAG: YncE family protein [Rubricoccaceae bacterium]